jgi:hypothetical protein
MWPVLGIQVSLPRHLRASEDTNFLVIRCLLCGWTVWFSVAGATLEELKKAAEGHRLCPARSPRRGKAGKTPGEAITPMRRHEEAANLLLVDTAGCCAGRYTQRA